MNTANNTEKLKGAAFTAGVVLVGFIVYGLIGMVSNKAPDDKKPALQGDYVVVFMDESARSIPQNIVLDDPQFDALKVAGMCGIVSITEPLMQANNYGPLLDACGGAPGMAIMDRKTGSLVKATRLPTDPEVCKQLLKKYCTTLPPPLPEQLPAPVVSLGGPLRKFADPNGLPVVEDKDEDGKPIFRRLAALPAGAALLGSLPNYGASNPLFPVKEWRPVSHRNLFGSKDWISNQGQISSCVANGWVGTIRRARVLYGMKDVPLSQGFFYNLINNQQDAGAIISDGIKAYCKTGTCTFDLIGQTPFLQRTIGGNRYSDAMKEAARFRGCDCFRCPDWESAGSAIQAGYVLTFGVMVGNNWTHFDKNGVCGHDKGPGNHCVAADGMVKIGNKWYLDGYNSWGYDFGPFKNGRMLLDKEHLFGNGDMADVCCIRLCGRDPKDEYAPPVYRHKAGDAQLGIAH